MSLLMTLVRTPRPQAVRQMRLVEGELVIGRSADADWMIDDPDQYVSRAHCTVSGRGGVFSVTDTSSGGLFVDEARTPLGAGCSLPLSDGMRLRLGDYVIEVESSGAEMAIPPEGRPNGRAEGVHADDFFATLSAEPPRPERPHDLPDPFERTPGFAAGGPPAERRGPPLFDDPFTLDPAADSRITEPAAEGFGWDAPASTPGPPPPADETFTWDGPAPALPAAGQRPVPASDASAVASFLQGLGIDPADAPGDPAARMEAFGREYRAMAEGLMQLLRMRADEKGNARIAQTVVSTRVNPLKFMPTIDDALVVLMSPSSGFTDAGTSIDGAVRDLAAHQVNTWRGIQAALARMVDRFAPETLEREIEALGLLSTLLAGGRRARLWELYERRFREIARSAETRFLGEVGADFRDAYEAEEE
jgi:type VI secretion system protein ImpI